MAITNSDLARIESLLAVANSLDVVSSLRQIVPGMTLTRCDAADMRDEAPFRVCGAFNLYLVDSSAHCWRLTSDARAATGLVLAKRH